MTSGRIIEYGCMRDEKFYERVKDVMLFKDTDGSFVTVSEYLDGATEGTVYYASEGEKQGYYISLYKEKGRRVLLLDKLMDAQFIQFIESKNNKLKFARVDADVDALGEKGRRQCRPDRAVPEGIRTRGFNRAFCFGRGRARLRLSV